jgi:hypothetical protein
MDDTIAVTEREMKRYELLKQVLKGRVGLAAATAGLGVSYRHAKRRKGKVADGGLPTLAHGNRGHPANDRWDHRCRHAYIAHSR